MDIILQHLRNNGVHAVKSDQTLLLEVFDEYKVANPVRVDDLIKRLIKNLKSDTVKRITLECPYGLFSQLKKD